VLYAKVFKQNMCECCECTCVCNLFLERKTALRVKRFANGIGEIEMGVEGQMVTVRW
jgi:hypothetical protein